MLARLFPWLYSQATAATGLAQTHPITARAALAAVASFALAVLCGRPLIAWLRVHFREPIKSASPTLDRLHAAKQFTPTMGGLFIVAGVTVATLLLADMANPFVLVALSLTLALTLLGAVDDLAKLRTSTRGLSARTKLIFQTAIAAAAAGAVYSIHAGTPGALALHLPFACGQVELGYGFVPLGMLVVVGASNAVNLTDGLDGLAGGCLLFSTGAMAALCYASGHGEWARALEIPHLPGTGEMLVVAAAMMGAVLGFLWFNCFPASVFMGDTGSLPLGGLLGLMAIVCRQELVFGLVAGVFVVEAASVLLQIGSCKLTGRRVLRCAPLHHHFQFCGWPENKIVVRFWIAAALMAVAGLGAVKLSAHDPASSGIASRQTARSPAEPPRLP